MELLNGITGFYHYKNNGPSKVDGKQFKQLCFTITIQNRGEVLAFKEPQYPMNFYYVLVKVFKRKFYILLHNQYPYLAFASDIEFAKINFIDVPELAKQFNPFYQVLSFKELNTPLDAKSFQNFHCSELEQAAYWRPETIGDVIFNDWD
ncbi:hypothetical protein H1Z61_06730 [Bacillus aquiflavi]|uniref:Uncharacterized protein n=1 Tax=Bacillus aquiflavi TaxID=2672567 RepID=A0A6B3VVC3_9BACI|nr:hypothetical protein [Bacillus aquiflavi]MBA4536841.1 hypothetical protein [Bacillus aquiflavi]NEY81208.1 hypothetical protein [Bacillus aquiflavi]